jgi:hypothetical protein
MRHKLCHLSVLFLLSPLALGQAAPQTRTLVVNGNSGDVPVIQQNGRAFVDLAALANIGNGSLSFNASRIVLTIPPSTAGAGAAAAPASESDDSKLSRDFRTAANEEIGLIREWAAPIANAIQNGYQIQEAWVARNREQAAGGLREASVAASTTADRNALDLLTNEFNGVGQWVDKMLAAQKSMDTAKYSMSPGTLRAEPQAQKLITCWHFLGSMLVSGSFQDDSSCH